MFFTTVKLGVFLKIWRRDVLVRWSFVTRSTLFSLIVYFRLDLFPLLLRLRLCRNFKHFWLNVKTAFLFSARLFTVRSPLNFSHICLLIDNPRVDMCSREASCSLDCSLASQSCMESGSLSQLTDMYSWPSRLSYSKLVQ